MFRSLSRLGFVASISMLLAGSGVASADSFVTTPSSNSKVAAKVGPPAYTGQSFSAKQAQKIVNKGANAIARNQNAAIRMDIVRIVDSATMDNPGAAKSMRGKLLALSKNGGPQEKFIRGYNLMFRTDSKAGLGMVRKSARALPTDSAIQLGAFQAVANYASHSGLGKGEVRKLNREAVGYLKTAMQLEKTSSNRPLVRENIKQSLDYLTYYPEMQKLMK